MITRSPVVFRNIGLLYPFVLLTSFYLILNGHKTPGGGFQGGALLAAVFILNYIRFPTRDIRLSVFNRIEKVMFGLIVALPVLFLFTGLGFRLTGLRGAYLIAMNTLIGVKVACGLSIIFFRFVFYENR